jgi:ParB family chromosome partitioning protein
LRTSWFDVISLPIVGGVAGDDAEHSGRQTRLFAELHHRERRQRRLLGRLQHHRVAGRERRAGLARWHRRGEVPRRDPSAGADGLP